jgi:hypothetical protein
MGRPAKLYRFKESEGINLWMKKDLD